MSTHIQRVLSQLLIEVTLLLRHVCIQDELLLPWQAVLHIALHPPQQEGLQDGVQLCDHLCAYTKGLHTVAGTCKTCDNTVKLCDHWHNW